MSVFTEEVESKPDMFRKLIEKSSDVTIVTDRDFKIRYISSSSSKIFGKESIHMLGSSVFELVGTNNSACWDTFLVSASKSKSQDLVLQIDGEEKFFTAYLTNLFDDHIISGLVIKLHDITKSKIREKALIDSSKHLDQVFYKTTHDLIAPIRSMMGLVTLAENSVEEKRAEYLLLIRKSLVKLDGFIEEMNDFFKGERLEIKRERIDLKSLIQSEVDSLRTLHNSSSIDIEIDFDKQVDFFSDLFRIKTILTNLISNSLKYLDSSKEKSFLKLNVLVNEKEAIFRIQDNGIGIEQQYLKKIFDQFFRATVHSYGNGIGLFIVKDTIERLNGRINVTSTFGKGTTFEVTIPNQSILTV